MCMGEKKGIWYVGAVPVFTLPSQRSCLCLGSKKMPAVNREYGRTPSHPALTGARGKSLHTDNDYTLLTLLVPLCTFYIRPEGLFLKINNKRWFLNTFSAKSL